MGSCQLINSSLVNISVASLKLGGVVCIVSDSWSRGRGFDSQPVDLQATTLGKLLTPMCLCHQQYNVVPTKGRWFSVAGKVTGGLASHWPCGPDFSGLSTYGLTATEKEMSTPPTLHTWAWSTLRFIMETSECVYYNLLSLCSNEDFEVLVLTQWLIKLIGDVRCYSTIQ